MPHPIVVIDELVRLVIDELVETSHPTLVSFALTCRSLEEPALSSLWKRQSSIIKLLKVLPQLTWVKVVPQYMVFPVNAYDVTITQDPSPRDWDRLRRYASWMRKLSLGREEGITIGTLSRLSSNSPGGLLLPKLEMLHWEVDIKYTHLPFFRLFLSPHLKFVDLHTEPNRGPFHQDMVPLIEAIPCLPTPLEHLSFTCGPWKEGPLKDVISSLVLQCGTSLRSFESVTPLSEAAFHHLMQLPHLRCLAPGYEPPRTLQLATFPPLEELRLGWGGLPWLHLLAARGEGEPRNNLVPAAAMLNTNIKETLKLLRCPWNTPIDSTLLSSVSLFRNLVTLYVSGNYCSVVGHCAFGLTDDDVENLSATLPRLESLQLGPPCWSNSCNTTVASLVSISIHCPGLTLLEIHFNTRTIVVDMQRLLGQGFRRDRPRCGLCRLPVKDLPLKMRGEDIGTVAMGFKVIFPRLEGFSGYGREWGVWRDVASELRSNGLLFPSRHPTA